MKLLPILCLFISSITALHADVQYGHVTIDNELPMVVIIPSYKNAHWCEDNLRSVYGQQYNNYRVIYINDCSPDNQIELVRSYVKSNHQEHRTTIIDNDVRRGAMSNWYNAIHSCDGHAIIVSLDGDDFLAHSKVLQYLNEVYKNENIWMTYGQFVEWPVKAMGFCKKFESEVVANCSYRKTELPMSHLRTFRAWLFQQIALTDFVYKDNFYTMTCDKAMAAPLLEMADGRYKCIDEILYIYNMGNPINDFRVNAVLQSNLFNVTRWKKRYKPLDKPIYLEEEFKKAKVNILFFSENYQLTQELFNRYTNSFINHIYVISDHENSENLKKNCPKNCTVIDSILHLKKYYDLLLQEAQYTLLLNDDSIICESDILEAVKLLIRTKGLVFDFTLTSSDLQILKIPAMKVGQYVGWHLFESYKSLKGYQLGQLHLTTNFIDDLKSASYTSEITLFEELNKNFSNLDAIYLCR